MPQYPFRNSRLNTLYKSNLIFYLQYSNERIRSALSYLSGDLGRTNL